MKKVIGIFMAIVFGFIFVSMAVADENPKTEDYIVIEMVETWCNKMGKISNLNHQIEGDTYYGKGIISEVELFKEYGKRFSFENLIDIYKTMIPDIYEINVKTVGFHEDYNVYELKIETTNTVLVNYNDMDYYKANMIFMVNEMSDREVEYFLGE